MVRQALEVAALVVTLASCAGRPPGGEEEAPPLATPPWAFEPWISKDISDGPDTRAFLAGFRERDIPVGVVVLDSPWETNYNTFVPNEERYPEFATMVQDFLDEDVRTVLWTTQMVNESSFDIEQGGDVYDGPADGYLEGQQNDYFVNDGETSLWWKGSGAAVDFFNPDAVAWWRAKQNALLDMGVAGWKLDFGEQYIEEQPIRTLAGEKSLQEYSEAYYRDFYVHGMNRIGGDDFVTMVRPYDESYGFAPRFYARPEHAPVTWVGDQRRDSVGLVDGLDHVFRSALAGYTVIGSDIGGYLDTDLGDPLPFELVTFRQWTAVSALMPFFQLHGRANLAPWTVDGTPADVEETVRQYRFWATLHHALVPYFHSLTREAQPKGLAILHPVGTSPGAWADDWRFFAGPAFLAAAIVDPTLHTRDVALPAHDALGLEDGARYVDFWDLEGPSVEGGAVVSFTRDDVRELPLWIREGAIVPLHIDSDALDGTHTRGLAKLGHASFARATTILAIPGPREARFTLHAWRKGDFSPPSTITLARTTDALTGRTTGAVLASDVAGRVVVRMRVPESLDVATVRAFVDGRLVPEAASLPELARGAAAFVREGRTLWIAADDARSFAVR